jgi:hypothetical protein
VDEDFEMIAVEVKGMDPKYSWKIIGIYRAPNEDILAIERLAARTLLTRNSTKRSIIGGDLNLSQTNWNGDAWKTSGFQAFVNKLVWENGYTQVARRGVTRCSTSSSSDLIIGLTLVTLYPESAIIAGSSITESIPGHVNKPPPPVNDISKCKQRVQ